MPLARYDIFEAMAAVFFALAVDGLATALRIRDYQARMQYKLLSTRDAFSGILNKRACEDAMASYLRASAPSAKCTFLILDLDDFKKVNDTSATWRAMQSCGKWGKRFRNCSALRHHRAFCGDEFVILAKGMASREGVERKCRKIRERMAAFPTDGATDGVSCSIGAILVRGQRADYNALFQQADAALYEAKKLANARTSSATTMAPAFEPRPLNPVPKAQGLPPARRKPLVVQRKPPLRAGFGRAYSYAQNRQPFSSNGRRVEKNLRQRAQRAALSSI